MQRYERFSISSLNERTRRGSIAVRDSRHSGAKSAKCERREREREQKEAEEKRVHSEATKEAKRQANALQQANAEKKRSSERRETRQRKNEDGSSGANGQVRSQRTTDKSAR